MTTATPRLRIALQKKGRLNDDSLALLRDCGIKFAIKNQALLCHSTNMPIDLLQVRDDDIPTLVADNVCHVGIVGNNVLQEKQCSKLRLVRQLGFGRCRLAIAVPNGSRYQSINDLQQRRIATSYPNLLRQFLAQHQVIASIVQLSGSVEIAPRLDIADAICDLVSTGQTLEENNLHEMQMILTSEAVLVQADTTLDSDLSAMLSLLLRRIDGIQQAQERKYIVFHAPKAALNAIQQLLPGCESPTLLPLEGDAQRVAVHVVSKEAVFWQTLENIKQAGASSILVLPIEKMML